MQTLKRITNPDKNGFILLDNILGVMRYAMHSPLFRGARIRNCFGKVILDLRQTRPETDETYIYLRCIVGKIILYIPDGWDIRFQNNAIACYQNDARIAHGAGGFEDKKVILQGFSLLSSIEIIGD